MAAEIEAVIKVQIPAGGANPAPPVGPALGQHGVNIMEFCNAFNEQTKDIEKGLPVPVEISVTKDRKFTFILKSPPAAVLLKRAAGVAKASATPNTAKVGKQLTRAQLEEIAKVKQADITAADMDAAVRTLAGTARSMGIEVNL